MILLRITACCLACCAAGLSVGRLYAPPPDRGLIVCHADGTTFVGHIDTRGISQADLSNAVVMMCRYRERMGV